MKLAMDGPGDPAEIDRVARRFCSLGLDIDVTIPILVCETTERFDAALGGEVPGWSVAAADGEAIYVLDPRLWNGWSCPGPLSEIIAHETAHMLLRRRGTAVPFWIGEGFAMLVADQLRYFDGRDGCGALTTCDPYDVDSSSVICYAAVAVPMRRLVALIGERRLAGHMYQTLSYADDPILGRRAMRELMRCEHR